MKLISYPRVSSAEQVAGYSIDAQIEACQLWAARHGHEIVAVYPEPGKSARTDRRPAFQRAINFVLAGGADGILVHRADRFARNLFDYLHYRAKLEAQGKMILSATEEFFNSATPETRMLASIVMAVGEFMAARIGQETVKGTTKKARSGKWPGGRPPNGYQRIDKNTIIIDPDLGPAIAQAFVEFASGRYTLDTWTDEARRRGVANFRGAPFSRKAWHDALTNIFYTGKFIWRDKEYEGDHPPLVSEIVFDMVQKIMAERNSGGKLQRHDWLLRGLLWSDVYQAPMSGSAGKNRYYRRRGPQGEHAVRADDLEERVILALDGICWDGYSIVAAPDKWRLAVQVSPHLGLFWPHLNPDEQPDFLQAVINPHGIVVDADGAIKKIHLRSGFSFLP